MAQNEKGELELESRTHVEIVFFFCEIIHQIQNKLNGTVGIILLERQHYLFILSLKN